MMLEIVWLRTRLLWSGLVFEYRLWKLGRMF